MTNVNILFLILFLLCLFVLILGLIKPSGLVKKEEEPPTRRKILKTLIPLMLIFSVLFGITTDNSVKETTSKVSKPEIQYAINKIDVPKTDSSTWSLGSKRQASYWVQVPKDTSQEQVKKIAEYIIETDAKPLKNWNVAWFVFVTPEKQNSGFATGLFTKNAKVSDGNNIKPGEYDGFSWEWKFYN